MASSTAKVDTGIMRNGAKIISDHADSIGYQESGVKNTVEQLMLTWKGVAAQTFDNGMQEFYAECEEIIKVLKGLSSSVTTAANNYDGHDDTVRTVAKNMATPGGGLTGF
jgi:WXG100 family type VII secretion target